MEQSKVKSVIKSIIPSSIIEMIGKKKRLHLISGAESRHRKALHKLQQKEKIRVAFFVIHTSVWKLDQVFQLMQKEDRFEPIIVVCPYIVYGDEEMLIEMNQAYSYFRGKGYETYRTYNESTKEWLDIKTVIQPDIVFFTNPHKLTREEYYINNFLDSLTCYVPYTFDITYQEQLQYNQIFHNLVWKMFYETPMHKEIARKQAVNKGINVEVTGYPGTDIFIDKEYVATDVWKGKSKYKRIIWAPHHSIEEDYFLTYSTFLYYYNFFKYLLVKYKGKIQIAFKPHPILKNKLYNHPDWGRKRTDEYYNFWATQENSQLEEFDYINLFLTSDGLILDSASFMVEYIYTHKPSQFLVHDDNLIDRFNDFGKQLFKKLYHASKKQDIIDFINNVVINAEDSKKEMRERFFQDYLLPPNQSASQNIYSTIANALKA